MLMNQVVSMILFPQITRKFWIYSLREFHTLPGCHILFLHILRNSNSIRSSSRLILHNLMQEYVDLVFGHKYHLGVTFQVLEKD